MKHAMAGLLLVAALHAAAPVCASDAPKPAAPVSQPAPAAAAAPTVAAVREEASFNPALVYRDQLLTGDAVWRGVVLVEGALTIAPQATLTIEPGTVVRFRRSGSQTPVLVVQGRLVAPGSKEAPIVFTSTFAVPAPSDWQGVMLLGSEKKNVVENCRIEGAATGFEVLFSNVTLKDVRAERSVTGMRFQDAVISMEGGGAFNCDTGLSFSESEATLRNIAAEGNRVGLQARRSSVYLSGVALSGNHGTALSCEGSRVKLQGGVVTGNGNGVTLMDCEGGIAGVSVAKNREHGISLTRSRIRVNGNQITGNGGNGIIVFDASSVAWGNAIHDNGQYDLYNAGKEEFRAPGNWWGAAGPRVFENAGQGRVIHVPVLTAQPSRNEPQ